MYRPRVARFLNGWKARACRGWRPSKSQKLGLATSFNVSLTYEAYRTANDFGGIAFGLFHDRGNPDRRAFRRASWPRLEKADRTTTIPRARHRPTGGAEPARADAANAW